MTHIVPILENKWMGGCGDSFCWGSCDSPHCKSEYRLGPTPEKHNLRVALNEIEDLETKRYEVWLMDRESRQ